MKFAYQNNLYLQTIDSCAIDNVWPLIADKFSKAERTTRGRLKQSDILQQIKQNNQQVWLARELTTDYIKAVCLTQIIAYPQLKSLYIDYVTGSDYEQWSWILDCMKEWALKEGCKLIEANGRLGWLKKHPPEFKPDRILFTMEL